MQSISPSELLRQKRLQLQTNLNPKPEWGGLTPRNGVPLPIKISAINNSKFTVTSSQKQFTTGKVFSPTGVFTKPSPPAQFSPTNIATLQLWLDAADSNTLSVSGGNVTQWNDKSGLSNNFTSVGTSTVSTQSGLGIVNMTAGGYFTNTTFAIPASYSVFFVGYTTSGSESLPTIFSANIDVSLWLRVNSSGVIAVDFGRGIAPWNNGITGPSVGSNSLIGFLMDNSGGGTARLYSSGNLSGSSTGNTAATTNVAIGYRLNNGNNWNGYLGEFLFYTSTLSSIQREQVEGYLAWKWRLQSSLPVGHPYKLAKP